MSFYCHTLQQKEHRRTCKLNAQCQGLRCCCSRQHLFRCCRYKSFCNFTTSIKTSRKNYIPGSLNFLVGFVKRVSAIFISGEYRLAKARYVLLHLCSCQELNVPVTPAVAFIRAPVQSDEPELDCFPRLYKLVRPTGHKQSFVRIGHERSVYETHLQSEQLMGKVL